MTKFTPSFVAEMRTLAEKATPRPWVPIFHICSDDVLYVCVNAGRNNTDQAQNDSRFSIAACNSYPAALDEIERLTARVAELEQAARWIPVGERFPEHDKVFDGRCSVYVEVVNGDECVSPAWYAFFSQKWMHCGEPLNNVTHYRPLPTPPEVSHE